MIKDNQFLKGKAKSFASKKQKNTVETNILCVYRIKKKNVWYLQKKSRREARKHVSFLCSISLGHRERERDKLTTTALKNKTLTVRIIYLNSFE